MKLSTSAVVAFVAALAVAPLTVNGQQQDGGPTTPEATTQEIQNLAGGEQTAEPPLVGADGGNETATTTAINAIFDCRRAGHDCHAEGGMCNTDTGACDCEDGYTAFDCSVVLLAIAENVTACNNGTGCGDEAEAFCVDVNFVNGNATVAANVTADDTAATAEASNATAAEPSYQCKCPYGRHGSACEKSLFELTCTGSSMTLHVTPYARDFAGRIYVIEMANSTQVDDEACAFGNATQQEGEDQEQRSSLSLSYADAIGKCGGESPANDTYEIRFVIQSDSEWLTSFDQVVTASCSLNVSQEYQKTIVVDAAAVAGVDAEGRALMGAGLARVSNDLSGVRTNVIAAQRRRVTVETVPAQPIIRLGHAQESENGTEIVPISGSVKIGDTVVFTIERGENDSFYTALRAEDCTLRMDDTMTAALIKDQCPASRFAWSLLSWSKTQVTESSVSFMLSLPAHALAGRPRQLTIACRVKMCALDAVDECAMDDDGCRNKTRSFVSSRTEVKNYGRKRRDVTEQQQQQQTTFAYAKKTFAISYNNADDLDDSDMSNQRRQRVQQQSSSASSLSLAIATLIATTSAIISSIAF